MVRQGVSAEEARVPLVGDNGGDGRLEEAILRLDTAGGDPIGDPVHSSGGGGAREAVVAGGESPTARGCGGRFPCTVRSAAAADHRSAILQRETVAEAHRRPVCSRKAPRLFRVVPRQQCPQRHRQQGAAGGAGDRTGPRLRHRCPLHPRRWRGVAAGYAGQHAAPELVRAARIGAAASAHAGRVSAAAGLPDRLQPLRVGVGVCPRYVDRLVAHAAAQGGGGAAGCNTAAAHTVAGGRRLRLGGRGHGRARTVGRRAAPVAPDAWPYRHRVGHACSGGAHVPAERACRGDRLQPGAAAGATVAVTAGRRTHRVFHHVVHPAGSCGAGAAAMARTDSPRRTQLATRVPGGRLGRGAPSRSAGDSGGASGRRRLACRLRPVRRAIQHHQLGAVGATDVRAGSQQCGSAHWGGHPFEYRVHARVDTRLVGGVRAHGRRRTRRQCPISEAEWRAPVASPRAPAMGHGLFRPPTGGGLPRGPIVRAPVAQRGPEHRCRRGAGHFCGGRAHRHHHARGGSHTGPATQLSRKRQCAVGQAKRSRVRRGARHHLQRDGLLSGAGDGGCDPASALLSARGGRLRRPGNTLRLCRPGGDRRHRCRRPPGDPSSIRRLLFECRVLCGTHRHRQGGIGAGGRSGGGVAAPAATAVAVDRADGGARRSALWHRRGRSHTDWPRRPGVHVGHVQRPAAVSRQCAAAIGAHGPARAATPAAVPPAVDRLRAVRRHQPAPGRTHRPLRRQVFGQCGGVASAAAGGWHGESATADARCGHASSVATAGAADIARRAGRAAGRRPSGVESRADRRARHLLGRGHVLSGHGGGGRVAAAARIQTIDTGRTVATAAVVAHTPSGGYGRRSGSAPVHGVSVAADRDADGQR
eukprot:ctg_221.g83